MTVCLTEKFNEYFELIPATTQDLKQEAFKLRHQVYCLETGFERQEDCQVDADGQGNPILLETDAYDSRSVHYLVRHRRSGLYAATVRLILPDYGNLEVPFPIEVHCPLHERIESPSKRRRLAEISRFAVSKEFKRRRGEAGTLAGVAEQAEVYFKPDERRIFPHLILGLFTGILRMTRAYDIDGWYAVMEPALLRLVQRFGIAFEPIGPDVDYHGVRRPCLAWVDEVLPSIKRTDQAIWDLVTQYGEYA